MVIAACSAVAVFLSAFGSPYGTYYGMGPGMMIGFSEAALVCGILVVIGAIMLNARPTQHMILSIIVLIFSIASFIEMGGYFTGAVLGIAGGAIALSYRAPITAQKE